MMLGGQKQEVQQGSLAVQGGGDINVSFGLSVAEVRDLVHVFLQQQLPALRVEAKKIAEENAANFLNEFVKQANSSSKASAVEMAKPDAQAAFQSALLGAAIKGDGVDLELVVAALIRRLEAADEPLIKLVLESVISLLPKLTRSQISFLAFVHYLKSVSHPSASELIQLEKYAELVISVVTPGLALSLPSQQYLAGLGLLVINPVANADIWLHEMCNKHSFFPTSEEVLRSSSSPNLSRMLDAYKAMSVPQVFLTITGSAIGILQLRRCFPDIQMEVWIS
jgi:hypothetical protein